jgi:APA family basic amino acid/polyamine antiporter
MNQLFAKKSLKTLLEEMAGEHRLKRVLGPISLTALGVGAVIGAGIFVATGSAAHNTAGPALMVSYCVAGVTCIFAALCYAEFASLAPVAGSAYTYAYTTLGELFAWIIGWDLVLEYAVGAATVANGWSGYSQSVLAKLGLVVPFMFSGAPYKYDHGHFLPNVVAQHAEATVTQSSKEEGEGADRKSVIWWVDRKTGDKLGRVGDAEFEQALTNRQQALFDLPAILVATLVTLVLVKGISESAGFNAVMVAIKVAAVLFVILVGMAYINTENWKPFAPYGWTGLSFLHSSNLS